MAGVVFEKDNALPILGIDVIFILVFLGTTVMLNIMCI